MSLLLAHRAPVGALDGRGCSIVHSTAGWKQLQAAWRARPLFTSGHGLSSAGDLADEIMLHASCIMHHAGGAEEEEEEEEEEEGAAVAGLARPAMQRCVGRGRRISDNRQAARSGLGATDRRTSGPRHPAVALGSALACSAAGGGLCCWRGRLFQCATGRCWGGRRGHPARRGGGRGDGGCIVTIGARRGPQRTSSALRTPEHASAQVEAAQRSPRGRTQGGARGSAADGGQQRGGLREP